MMAGEPPWRDRVKGRSTAIALSGIAFAMLAILVVLQLTVHDPHHVLLTAVGSWGILSLPIGLLVGHFARDTGAALQESGAEED